MSHPRIVLKEIVLEKLDPIVFEMTNLIAAYEGYRLIELMV